MSRKPKYGFTLIEVLVVLSILALVAVLSFTLIGSTVKKTQLKAKIEKLNKDLITIESAWNMYILKNGHEPQGATYVEWLDELVSSGLLKEIPSIDKSITTNAAPYFTINKSNANSLGNSKRDTNIWVRYLTEEACALVNETYADISGIPEAGNPVYSNDFQCWMYDTRYYGYKIIEVDSE